MVSALEYGEAHQHDLPLSGYVTYRQLRDLRHVIENIDFRIARLSGAGCELARVTSALQADLERTRAELLAHIERVRSERAPGAVALSRHGVHIVGRALQGEADRDEVLDYIEAICSFTAWRREHGEVPYSEDLERWAEVFQRLADNLPADIVDWRVSELLQRPASDRSTAG